jgi:exonuclease III
LIFRNSAISGVASRATEIQHGPGTALYTDAFRTLYPGEGGHFTFCDYFRQAFARNRGIRIDHFLMSPQLAKSLVSCEIDAGPRGAGKPSHG